MAMRAKALARVTRSSLVLDAGDRLVETGDQRLQPMLRRVEDEMRLGNVVGRLAIGIHQLPEIRSEGEGRDVRAGRQKLLELNRIVAFQRRAGRSWPAAFPCRCFWQKYRRLPAQPASPRRGAEQQVWCWPIDINWSSGRIAATVFVSSTTSRVRRTEPVETVETKRRPVPANAVPDWPDEILQHDDARDHRLRNGAVLFDVGFGDRGQAGVHGHFLIGMILPAIGGKILGLAGGGEIHVERLVQPAEQQGCRRRNIRRLAVQPQAPRCRRAGPPDGWRSADKPARASTRIHQEPRGAAVAVVEGMDADKPAVRFEGGLRCVLFIGQPVAESLHQRGYFHGCRKSKMPASVFT